MVVASPRWHRIEGLDRTARARHCELDHRDLQVRPDVVAMMEPGTRDDGVDERGTICAVDGEDKVKCVLRQIQLQ